MMSIKTTQEQLIIANIILFVVSFLFSEYSKMFRMDQEKHWIYSCGHNWWFMAAIPSAFWGSLVSGGYSLWKTRNYKFLYFIFSMVPLVIFILIVFI
ncbi:hypothetical protein [uncultured Chryseobacterium sp.]|uniref:hypothetical protein n=1 Tax=uncultured Chryseobacterium sp. TaxID=259322 RepID=UPI003747D34A